MNLLSCLHRVNPDRLRDEEIMRQFAFSWMFLSFYQEIEIFNLTHYP